MLAFLARFNLRGPREADELLAARTEALDAHAARHRARPVPLVVLVAQLVVDVLEDVVYNEAARLGPEPAGCILGIRSNRAH